ncbi:MAG: choice-of-anchor D domain-containing protein [Bradyrhizobiaceae bacterium]|nr:choice-of-anchor D domain-containing protein [Bradyrhizobiaceae bacterium]
MARPSSMRCMWERMLRTLQTQRSIQSVCCAALCLVGVAIAITAVPVQGQTALDLVDQMPPYLLSAKILNNGHFSITTNYTGTSKTLIYREDGTGNRPVNYTSHIHVKVDDVVYQMPYEVDRTTDLPPPPNPMKVLYLFRDTVERRPRINAQLLAMASNGDSIRVTFTMEPVARPSGAFIRMSVALENAGFTQHNVGVLMLVDTKIGNNDRAPIGTAFGYSGIESEYRKSTAPGLPEFWIAIEGTPLAPGLTARGNLRASDLIEPDRFLFGNWVDDNGAGIPGLYKVLWDERVPSGLSFTDSAILLLWEQKQLGARARRLHAATEIGLVDSLVVSFGSGNGGGGGGGGGSLGVAGPGSCLQVDTLVEDTCGKLGYSPYSPDTVAGLYLVTNTGKTTINGLNLVLGTLPPGLQALMPSVGVVPPTLVPDQTGVTVLPIVTRPRLFATTYDVPIAFIDAIPDTILRDTVCISVPGILASIKAEDLTALPVCPGNKDTVALPVKLNGIRCLPVDRAAVLSPPTAPARILSPLPLLPAEGFGSILVEVAPTAEDTTQVTIEVVVRDWESLVDGDTTWVDVLDTMVLTVIGKHAEVQALVASDTLIMPTICINENALDSMQIQNVGGCEAVLSTITLSNDAGGVFSIDSRTPVPLAIARAARGQLFVSASSPVPGTFVGELEITTIAKPGTIHVPVKVVVEKPDYVLQSDTLYLDTVCPGVVTTRAFQLLNETACDVAIDSIRQISVDSVVISPPDGFVIGANSTISLGVSVTPGILDGAFTATFRVYSATAGNRDVVVVGYAALLSASVAATRDMGRVRVGTAVSLATSNLDVVNNGTKPITILGVRFVGPHASEFVAAPVFPVTFPITVMPGSTATVDILCTPTAIGFRRATAIVDFKEVLCVAPSTTQYQAYGVQPLLDIERHDVQQGTVCIGSNADTTWMLRNLGNEPLHITAITCSGSLQPILPEPLPVTLDSGASVTLPVQLTTNVIGQQSCECIVTTDADWFTQKDTTVRMGLTGVVCATMWVDTVSGYIGLKNPVRIHFEPDERTQLTREQLTQQLATYGATTQLRLQADQSVARFDSAMTGMMEGAQLVVSPTDLRIQAAGLPNAASPVFAEATIDVLLGNSTRTDVRLLVDSLANGFYDLRIHNGLLRAEYCAFDKRQVQVSPKTIIAVRQANGAAIITAFRDVSVSVRWVNLRGDVVAESVNRIGTETPTIIPMPLYAEPMLFAIVTPLDATSGETQTVSVIR